MSRRTYHDPLHGAIQLDSAEPAEALAIDLIDTPAFQRLRRIRQLGTAFLTYHGAESSRFTHSIGVLHMARLALRQLETRHPQLAEHRCLLYAAALLHDLGHPPLSHVGEAMFGLRHEHWSGRLIRELPELRDRLEAAGAGLAEAVATLLETGHCRQPAIAALVSSQLDCDRLDYLMRDSHSTGTSFARLDLERILAALTLAPDDSLAIHPRGLMAVEHYLVARQLMYRAVYNHRLNVVSNWLLQRTVKVARRLTPPQLWSDGVMARWLWQPDDLGTEAYLANDDIRTAYHLMRWKEEGPSELSELCGRILERRLLRATDVSELPSEERLELLAEAQGLARAEGLVAESCCGMQRRRSLGYHPYRGGLRLWDGHRLQALESRSPLVHTLARSHETTWLIHPAGISMELNLRLADRLGNRMELARP